MREICGGVFQGRFHNLLISKNNTFWAPQISRITFQVVCRKLWRKPGANFGTNLAQMFRPSRRSIYTASDVWRRWQARRPYLPLAADLAGACAVAHPGRLPGTTAGQLPVVP